MKAAGAIMTSAAAAATIMLGGAFSLAAGTDRSPGEWLIDTADEWLAATAASESLTFAHGMATPRSGAATFCSVVKTFDNPRKFGKITLTQSPEWKNWEPVGKLGPPNLEDAPVFLVKGPGDYWMFGLYRNGKGEVGKTGVPEHAPGFKAQPARLEGFDVPLMTTPFPHQYDAPGGLKPGLGGYHAWQSRDMTNWVHHGPVTDKVSRWVTTAEHVDGNTYMYYDYPNDQDPHLFIDDDLTDGLPGRNMGLAFQDPSDGSDCTIIRDLEGRFHVIYEDWSPINARAHSWDSPLAGHAVSQDGIKDFKILPPALDQRTRPTGRKGSYEHPHWLQHAVKESYQGIAGFSKQIERIPAEMDLSGLPAARGFGFELRIKDTTSNPSLPVLDSVRISFE